MTTALIALCLSPLTVALAILPARLADARRADAEIAAVRLRLRYGVPSDER